ncbi:MAG TPA: cytochrome c [Polyangiales bacterium]
MVKRVMLGCVLAAGLAAAACGGDDGGDDVGGSDAGGSGGNCSDTYNSYIKARFAATDANCGVCHGAMPVGDGNTLSLDTYAEVKAEKDHIIAHVVNLEMPIMPMGSTGLPKADRDRIKAWFDCGAPE